MTETTTDSAGKVMCSVGNCRETGGEACRFESDRSCSGSCPSGGYCILQTHTDPATGATKSGCACARGECWQHPRYLP